MEIKEARSSLSWRLIELHGSLPGRRRRATDVGTPSFSRKAPLGAPARRPGDRQFGMGMGAFCAQLWAVPVASLSREMQIPEHMSRCLGSLAKFSTVRAGWRSWALYPGRKTPLAGSGSEPVLLFPGPEFHCCLGTNGQPGTDRGDLARTGRHITAFNEGEQKERQREAHQNAAPAEVS